MPKVLITTVPFGNQNTYPLDLLKKSDIDYLINPLNKKLTEDETVELLMIYLKSEGYKILDYCSSKAFDFFPRFLTYVALLMLIGKREIELLECCWKEPITQKEKEDEELMREMEKYQEDRKRERDRKYGLNRDNES